MISERREPLAVSFCTPDLKCDVLPLNVAKLAEPLPKSLKKSRGWEFRGQNANSVEFNGLLRRRTQWPSDRRPTEKDDELAPAWLIEAHVPHRLAAAPHVKLSRHSGWEKLI
jgi:hypothetical protein